MYRNVKYLACSCVLQMAEILIRVPYCSPSPSVLLLSYAYEGFIPAKKNVLVRSCHYGQPTPVCGEDKAVGVASGSAGEVENCSSHLLIPAEPSGRDE
jgi:hypothetical protein